MDLIIVVGMLMAVLASAGLAAVQWGAESRPDFAEEATDRPVE